MAMNKYLSIITLNINGLNAPIKRHRIAEWIRKHDHKYTAYRDLPQNRRPTQTESEGWKQIVQANGQEKKKKRVEKNNRSSKQNINKDIMALNNALDEMDLTNIHTAFHPKEAKYTFFSSVHGTVSKIDHIIGHKTSLKKMQEN